MLMPLTREQALKIAMRRERVLKESFAIYLLGSLQGDMPFHDASGY